MVVGNRGFRHPTHSKHKILRIISLLRIHMFRMLETVRRMHKTLIYETIS